MTIRTKILLAVLILGLIFSSMFGINYNITNGFEFNSFWYVLLPIKLLDFSGSDPNQLYLTSRILGYFIYALFGILLFTDFKTNRTGILSYIFYLLIVFYAIYFEGNAILQDIRVNYTGQHLWIGTTLFILGLYNLNRKFKILKFKKLQTITRA